MRLRNIHDVRLFSIAITALALLGNLLLQKLMFPPEIVEAILVKGSFIVVIIAAPISYFVGLKLLDVIILSQKLEHAVNHDNLTGASTRSNFYKRLEPSGTSAWF